MKRIFMLCCIVLGGVILTPCFSFSFGHIPDTSLNCSACHSAHNGILPTCTDCHNNSSGGNYSDFNTIEMATHSSAVIGSDKYDPWGQECSDCHIGHEQNGLTAAGGLTDNSYVFVDLIANDAVTDPVTLTTTFTMTDVHIYDPVWADPATWGEKTGPERGLLFLIKKSNNRFYSFEVISATDTTITIGNSSTVFPQAPTENPIFAQLIYGMHIDDIVNGSSVKFGGPKTMANDESGTGFDPTPDGICQVCHTQTTHWRNDGSFTNHFNGRNCTMCHPHEQGFKAVPPLLCP